MIRLAIYIWCILKSLWHKLFLQNNTNRHHSKQKSIQFIPYSQNHAKPEWVKYKVLTLKAYLPHQGCRKIANHFNRQYAHQNISVSKSYVYRVIKENNLKILHLRKKLKHHIPKSLPKNLIWSIDLTTIHKQQIFGIIDSGTRTLLTLKHLPTKSTINIIRAILDIIETYNKPKILKSDNEKVFTSKLMKFTLWLLHIKHQRTDIASPWQNGKIERLFGTFKYHLYHSKKKIKLKLLQATLDEFRFYYNHIRPHQHLHFKTPSEAWDNSHMITSKDTNDIYSFKGKYLPVNGFYMRR